MNQVVPSEEGGVKEWYSLPLKMNLGNAGTDEFPSLVIQVWASPKFGRKTGREMT